MSANIELSAEDVQHLCENYLKSTKGWFKIEDNISLKVLNYNFKPVSDTPSGFLGGHNFMYVNLEIHDKKQSHSNEETLCFFTKSAPQDVASRMEYLTEFGVFKKEIQVYSEVMPELERIFGAVAPICFYAQNNVLIFENLLLKGYSMAASRDGLLNYEHLQCALKSLAALHGSSLVLEVRKNRKLNEMFAEAVQENGYPVGKSISSQHVRIQNFNNALLVFKEIIKTLPQYVKMLDVILPKFETVMKTVFEMSITSNKYQNVFLHGDLWANNIMFEYEQNTNVPIHCRFVDFQLARYAPPMLDVITVLTIPSSRHFREQHLRELLQVYHNYLGEYLTSEGLDIEDYVSKKQFFESYQDFRLYGLIESCLFSHLTILPSELTQCLTTSTDGFSDFFDRRRIEICMKAYEQDAIYRERMSDMIQDIIDNFVLK